MVLRYNMLTCVPESIKNIECEIHGNNINIIKNIVKNIVNDVKKINLDVHQTYIQKSLIKSIMYLMSTYKTHPYNNNYLYDIKMYISGNVFNYYINTIFKNTKKGYFFKLLDIYDSLPSDIIYDFNRDLKCKINNLLDFRRNIEKKYKPDFVITTYVEEKQTKHITFNITENNIDTDDFNLWLDIDVYQAELLAKKILRLVEDRKEFMSKILDDEKL